MGCHWFLTIIFVLKAGDLPPCTLELPARVKPRTFSFYSLFLLTKLMTHEKGRYEIHILSGKLLLK